MGSTLARTIALGGGKGGAGRTTIALLLAKQLAHRGWRVLLVDADTVAPSHHLLLGMDPIEPPRGPGIGDPALPLHRFVRESPVAGLSLLTLAHARGYPYVRPRINAPSLIERLEALDHDTAIIDLPSGHDPVPVALMALCEAPLLVVNPEIVGVVAATQHLRASVFHGLGFHPECYEAEDELLMLLREQGLGMSRESLEQPFLSAIGRRIVRETRANITPSLILNKVRVNQGAALNATLSMAWGQLLGLMPRALCQIPYDPDHTPPGEQGHGVPGKLEAAVADLARLLEDHQAHLTRHPRPLASTTSPQGLLGLSNTVTPKVLSARLEGALKILRDPPAGLKLILPQDTRSDLESRVLAALQELEPSDAPRARPAPPPHAALSATQVHPDSALITARTQPPGPASELWLTEDLSQDHDGEPEQAQAPEPAPALPTELASVTAPGPLAAPQGDLRSTNAATTVDAEWTHDLARSGTPGTPAPTSLMQRVAAARAAERGASSEVAAPPPSNSSPQEAADPAADDASEQEPPTEPSRPEPPPPRVPPANSPGAKLRDVRRENNMSLRELSLRTKIGVKYLEAIETSDRKVLPRPVYLRGYLREIAQVFKLDESALITEYFTYLGFP